MEFAKNLSNACLVDACDLKTVETEVEIKIAHQVVQPAISNRQLKMLAQALANLAWNLICRIKNGLQRSELLQPLCGCLRSNPRYSRQIVRCLSNECGQVWILLGVNGVFCIDRLVIHAGKIQHTLDRIENCGVFANQLKCVSVTRHHENSITLIGCLIGKACQYVVCLIVVSGDVFNVHRV